VAVAAVVVLPVGIAHAGADLLRWDVLPLGLAVAIVSGSLPYLFEMAAMRRVPTRVYGVLTSLEPAFGALFGYLLLAQDLTMTQSLAIAAVMAASLGSTLTHSPPPPAI
jgi:inner membrane transporter RhtA